MRFRWLIFTLTVLSWATVRAAESDVLVEVRNGKSVTTGKLLAKSQDKATLLDRTGQLHECDLKAHTLKTLSGSFQSLPTMEVRNQLAREFGKDFELSATRQFVVLAAPRKAAAYAAVFQEQFATLQRYFKTRGFVLSEPQFPLVAIVFPNQAQFVEYAQADGAKGMSHMLGYYSPRTNRVALFETRGKEVARSPLDSLPVAAPWSAFGSAQGDLRSTMIHEATHQIAYNIGLHSRLGETPRWVIEGMATVFEPDGVRDSSTGWSVKQRINRDRFIGFQNFAKSRRPAKSLKSFLEGDSLFQSAAPDFYAQSWALSFFLMETRSRHYSAYLKRIAARDPFADYPASERLADFKDAFQADFDWLEAQFLRYMDGLN